MRCISMWLLHAGSNYVRRGSAEGIGLSVAGSRDPGSDERQYLPLRRLSQYCRGGKTVAITEELSMRDFAYTPATDIDGAITAGQRENALFIAGGTCLVDLMKLGVEAPEELVDIHRLPLAGIQEMADGGLQIGAMTRNSAVAYHPLVLARYPILSEALLSGASAQLRNMATVGGNLMQRTRCTYFRNIHDACNKRTPGAGCAAATGFHRMHAILGTSEHCFATHPSDMSVALNVLDGAVEVRGAKGTRNIPISEFHTLPGS